QTGVCPSMKDCLTDFNIGYIGAGVLAIGFLSLGALVMFGAGEEFASGGSGFANQLVSLYTATMGDWAYWIIIICAFTTMFSTTLTVTDAYPRVTEELLKPIIPSHWDGPGLYRSLLVLISTGSLIVMAIAGSAFTLLVDLATTLSFLTAPVLAYLNYKLVMDAHFPEAYTPPRWLQWLSVSGLLFLTGFALVYVYWNIRFG
ncbi:MAG: divalent metal cation transporter, partial [Bacteroidota bacterium]